MSEKQRYENITEKIQVVYTEEGRKKEVIPGGTVLLSEERARVYGNILRKK